MLVLVKFNQLVMRQSSLGSPLNGDRDVLVGFPFDRGNRADDALTWKRLKVLLRALDYCFRTPLTLGVPRDALERMLYRDETGESDALNHLSALKGCALCSRTAISLCCLESAY